jgi:hypothetical protein
MRDNLKKIATGSMIAGAALFVAACGSSTTNNSTNVTDMGNDTMYDANATDMGMDTNMSMDANATMPASNMSGGNMSGGNMAAPATGNATNGM